MLLPLIFDQFFVVAIGLLTTAMISSSSQESVVAVSLVSPLCTMIYSLYSAVSSAGAVIVAQFQGHGNETAVKRAAVQILLFTFCTAVFFVGFIVFWGDAICLAMFGSANGPIIAKASLYLKGCIVSFLFLSLYMACCAVFRGIGNTKICLKLSVVINCTHLLGSFLFINILKMDIMGTVLSLNLARCIGGLLAVLSLLTGKAGFSVSFQDILRLDIDILKSVAKTSSLFALEQLCFDGGGILVSMFLVSLGTAPIAANAVTSATISIFYAVGLAVSYLSVTVIGQCIGAGDQNAARFYGKRLLLLGEAAILLSIVVLMPFLNGILKLYQAPADTLQQIHGLVAIILVPLVLFWAASNILPNVLSAAGDVKFATFVSLLTMWLIRVGLSYLVTIQMGVGIAGVWICLGLEWFIRTVIFGARFLSGKWQNKALKC